MHMERNAEKFRNLKPETLLRFRDWIKYNGHIVDAFRKYALELYDSGQRSRYSAYCIRERIRWDTMLTETGTAFKISNDFTPIIARLVMIKEKKLRGMFTVKHDA
jgi:hypothetical protein